MKVNEKITIRKVLEYHIMVKEEDMKANLKIMMQLVMISDMIIIKYYIKGNLMLINIIDME